MPAGCVKLVLHVEGAQGGVLHDQVLFKEAEAADVEAGGVARRPGYQRPADLEPPFLALQIPHVLAEAGVSSLLLVLEAGRVVVSSGLPIGFGPAQVGLHLLHPRVHHAGEFVLTSLVGRVLTAHWGAIYL